MDFTTIPRDLIYCERHSLEAFGVYNDDCINSSICEVMLELDCIRSSNDSESLALTCFNEAYYICTMVLMEKDPRWRLNQYKVIAFVNGNNSIRALILSMVYYYLSSEKNQLNKYQGILKGKLFEEIRYTDIFVFLSRKIPPFFVDLTCDEFSPRPIDKKMLNEIEFDEDDWSNITDDFDRRRISDLVFSLGKSVSEKMTLANEIENKAKLYYNDSSFFKGEVIPILDGIREDIYHEYLAMEIWDSAIEEERREEFENLGDVRPLNQRIEDLEKENKSLQEQVESLSSEKSDFVDEIKKKEQIIKEQKETIDELSVPAVEIPAHQKVRMEMVWQLFEKAGLTQDILKRYGNKSKTATLMGSLLDIPVKTCAQYLSERVLSRHRHKETISQLNNTIKDLKMDLDL